MSNAAVGFAPVARADATVLILGSMPGQKSLEAHAYYAHPRNAFWPIILQIFQSEAVAYQDRLSLLLDKQIALWDVLAECERKGSLDADIKSDSIMVNDFSAFLFDHSAIKQILFNGGKARQVFKRYVEKALPSDYFHNIKLVQLPSTSPAHASVAFDSKLSQWQQAILANRFDD